MCNILIIVILCVSLILVGFMLVIAINIIKLIKLEKEARMTEFTYFTKTLERK